MENKDNNIIEITSHSGFIVSDESILDEHYTQNPKITNPIAKNFSKFVQRSKDKFSLKDIFR